MHSVLPHLCKELPTGRLYYTWFSAMHTRVDFLLWTDEAESFLDGFSDRAYREILRIETVANAFDPSSELSLVNQHACEGWISVSPELYNILSLAISYNRKTFGLFDVTSGSVPFDSECIFHVELSNPYQVRFTRPGVQINLSGFIKGYALECIRSLIRETPIIGALINMGNSSIMGIGSRGEGLPWEVPYDKDGIQKVELRDECLTTSGNDTSERRHILNPRTGCLLQGKRSTAVITSDGIEGEILSTAFFIANTEERRRLMASFDVRQVIDLDK